MNELVIVLFIAIPVAIISGIACLFIWIVNAFRNWNETRYIRAVLRGG